MKNLALVSVLVIVCVVVAGVAAVSWLYLANSPPKDNSGFVLLTQSDNTTLLSGGDVVSFNQTSQEFTIVDAAAQRFTSQRESLYNFTNVVVLKVNGEEIYQGVFRSAVMSALPEPPKIAILYPSYNYSSDTENDHALRLFYPNFEVPSSQTENNAKIAAYFQEAGKLVS